MSIQLKVLSVILLAAWTAAAWGQDGSAASPLPERAAAPAKDAKNVKVAKVAKVAGTGFPTLVIYTNIPGDPSAAVPGLPGTSFGPGTGTTHFDRVFGSPGGSWILTADTDRPTTNDEVILVNDVVTAIEGDPASWTGDTENIGLIDTRVGVNDRGAWVFSTNTDGPTGTDEYVVKVTGGVFTAEAQEGGAIAALPGATWGATLETPAIASDGKVGLVGDGIQGAGPTTMDEIAVLDTTVLAREGVDVPTGQIGSETWENFDVDDFWISADGAHWLIQGDLAGATATDDVVVVDGAVVVQEGAVLPGSGFAEPVDDSGIIGVHMDPAGNWLVRGNNDVTEQDWVYRNGAVVAATGSPVFTGATELWSDVDFADCFFMHVGNTAGDFVIGGVSDAASTMNGLLVLNGETVVVRESDPIDLDGNGTFDDDLFFDTFGNDDAHLTDDGFFYVVATVKDGTGTRLGQGFFRIDLTSIIPVELMSFTVD